MNPLRPATCLSLTLALAACSLGSIGKPVPQAATYAIDVAPPTSPSAGSTRQASLRVGHVRVAAPYSGEGLVYRTDDVRLISDPYSQFITDPGTMLGDQLAAWLEGSGTFRNVAHPETTRPADYLLEATVTELYGDFRPHQPPTAVLSVQFALLDARGVRPRSVMERTLTRRVSLPKASPEELVRGYGQAFTQILGELTADLRSAPAR